MKYRVYDDIDDLWREAELIDGIFYLNGDEGEVEIENAPKWEVIQR